MVMYSGMAATSFEVLAEPTRRRIVELLLERSRPVGELVDLLGISQPGVSKHLRVLRDGGFVSVRADAQRRFYELRPAPLAELDAWLEPYRRLWAGRLHPLQRPLHARDESEQRCPPTRGPPTRPTARSRHAAAAMSCAT